MKKNLLLFTLLLSIFAVSFAEQKVVYIPLTNVTAVGQRKHFFDDEFAKYGYKVKVVDISAVKISGATAAMLDRGELNFSGSMAYMATDYRLNGFKTKVIWAAEPTIRKSVVLFAAKDSPYKCIADLKGQTIGTIRYCCGYAAALEIFQHAGYPIDTDLKKGDVRVWIAPGSTQIQQALLAGKIQGASDHFQVSAHTTAYLQGLYRLLDTLPDNSIYQRFGGRSYVYGTEKWINANPHLAQAYGRAYDKSINYLINNKKEAAEIVAKDLRLPIGIANFQINSDWASIAPSERSWEKTVESLKEVQRQYKNLGEPLYLRKTLSDAELEEFVDKRFFEGGEYSVFN